MEKTVRLIFSGALQVGRELAEVKAGLPALMKIPPEQVEKLFSGKPVLIKRGLPASKLSNYLMLLEKAGLAVQVEDEAPESELTLAPIAAPVSAPTERDVAAQQEASVQPQVEMACPKCGFKQPKRTLCRECGVDMPRYAVAQAELKTEAANPVPNSAQSPYSATTASTLARGFAAVQEDLPPIFAFDLLGRLNRVRYLVYGMVMQTALAIAGFMMIGSLFTSLFGGGGFPIILSLLFLALLLAMMFFGIRFSVLRLHDMGYTGWLVLLIFVPVIGWMAGIWFMIWPGSKEENLYGLPNPPNSGVHYAILIGALVLTLAVFGLMIRKVMTYQHDMQQHMTRTQHSRGMPLQQQQPGGFEQPLPGRR